MPRVAALLAALVIRKHMVKKMFAKGFTLIELLIVVLLIGVLSGAVIKIINVGGIQSKTRDSQRIADLKKIQTALELYFTDNRVYPASANWLAITGSDALSTVLQPGYIVKVPTDPKPSGSGTNPCSTNSGYLYKTDISGTYYVLTARAEVASSADAGLCSSLYNCGGSGIISGCNCGTPCYGVQNP